MYSWTNNETKDKQMIDGQVRSFGVVQGHGK